MNLDQIFGSGSARTGLIGAGQFGAALIGQAPRIPGLELSVVCDLDPERAVSLCTQAGYSDVRRVGDRASLERGIREGALVVTDDARLAAGAPVDIVIEATGHPATAAMTADAAINAGNSVAMVTKEAESVVGPELTARAKSAGVVYTPVDGDQPSLLIGLVAWATRLGLDVICAGKSSEYDFVLDPATETVSWQDKTVTAPGLNTSTVLGDDIGATLERRAELLAALPQRTVPDLTEMSVVCNATGLQPDVPEFHLPLARTPEIPDVFRPVGDGGILRRTGVVDVFNCLRRADEASFAGGVFVVVRCIDRDTWEILREKGHPVSRCGGYGMLYNPQHLLGLEAATTVMSAVLLGKSSGNPDTRPVVDVVARAARDFNEGDTLSITDAHHHEVDGLSPRVVDAVPLAPGNPVPYYLATEQRLVKPLKAGEFVTGAHIEPGNDALYHMREAQDRRFLQAGD